MENVIVCSRELSRGKEHAVYLTEDGDIVKAPTRFGRLWHKMNPGFAARD